MQWLGSIRIGQPLGFALMTAWAVLMASALIGFSIWGEVTRKARLPGLLEPAGGVLNIAAPQPGSVAEMLVREGEWVRAGQPLIRLRSERGVAGGDVAVLAAHFLEQRRDMFNAERLLAQQQRRQQDGALQERLRSLAAEERQAIAERETMATRASLAQKSLERFTELARGGFMSEIQVQQRQEELLDIQSRLRNAERNLEALRRDQRALGAELDASRIAGRAGDSQFERSLASLSQEAAENEARGGVTVTAPRAGRITAIPQAAGQSVQAGQTLVSLAAAESGRDAPADQELRAYLFAPSRTAGFVREGQVAWLRYAAFPYQKFGMAEGEVIAVSRTPIAPQDLPAGQAQALLGAAQSQEPLYRIQVRLRKQTIATYGQAQALRAGMALEADVIQDRRAIWEWLLEPILASTRRAV